MAPVVVAAVQIQLIQGAPLEEGEFILERGEPWAQSRGSPRGADPTWLRGTGWGGRAMGPQAQAAGIAGPRKLEEVGSRFPGAASTEDGQLWLYPTQVGCGCPWESHLAPRPPVWTLRGSSSFSPLDQRFP